LLTNRCRAAGLLDFVHDQFACRRRVWVLNVVDDVSRDYQAKINGFSQEIDELNRHEGVLLIAALVCMFKCCCRIRQ
jgi:hypothetical protein